MFVVTRQCATIGEVPRAWALVETEDEVVAALDRFSRTAPILRSYIDTDHPVMIANTNRFYVSTINH